MFMSIENLRILSAAMMQLDTFFEDKRKSFAINSLLASQGLPTINPKKIISSGKVSKWIDRGQYHSLCSNL